jgi:hypothetical protein
MLSCRAADDVEQLDGISGEAAARLGHEGQELRVLASGDGCVLGAFDCLPRLGRVRPQLALACRPCTSGANVVGAGRVSRGAQCAATPSSIRRTTCSWFQAPKRRQTVEDTRPASSSCQFLHQPLPASRLFIGKRWPAELDAALRWSQRQSSQPLQHRNKLALRRDDKDAHGGPSVA